MASTMMKNPGHDDRRRVHQPQRDQRGEARDCGDADDDAAAHDGGAASRIGTAAAPERDGGIDDEGSQQQVADLRHDGQGVGDADGARHNGAAPQRQPVHRGDLGKVDVHAGREVQRQPQQAHTGGRPGEPEPPGVEVEVHEPDDRQHEQSPAARAPSAVWRRTRRRWRVHHRQLEDTEDSRRDCERKEQQVGDLRSLLEPDEEDEPRRASGSPQTCRPRRSRSSSSRHYRRAQLRERPTASWRRDPDQRRFPFSSIASSFVISASQH